MSRRAKGQARLLLAVGAALLASALWLAASLTSAGAAASPNDIYATRSYLQAEVAIYDALVANMHLGVVAGEELAARLSKECSGVATGALRGTGGAKLREETIYAAVLAVVTPDLATFQSAVDTLMHLRWRNRRLTVLVHRLTLEHSGALIPSPDLCRDWKEWIAGGFKALPAATTRFLAQIGRTMNVGASEVDDRIAPLLRPYEGPREISLRHQLDHLRKLIDHRLTPSLLIVLHKMEKALGLPAAIELGPGALLTSPPASVVQSGGKRLEEFYLGRKVVAESGCLACHRIGEYGNSGPGPDLTHVGSTVTGTQIARALINPKEPMPSFRRLPKAKFDGVVEFLSLLH